MAGKEEDTMGISRSGRIRKKSSKLMDFESPEEAELSSRSNRGKGAAASKGKIPKLAEGPKIVPPLQIKLPKNKMDMSFDHHDAPSYSEDESFSPKKEFAEDSSSQPKTEEGSEDDSEEDVDVAGPSTDPPLSGPKQPSLYLLEKNKKKMVFRDGKFAAAVKQKAQRKDKGKARFTAYNLWTKEMRPVVSRQNPDMKFDAVTKKLSELWSTVSQAERLTWKRRAIKQASKSSGGMISTGVVKPIPAPKPAKISPKPKPVRARSSPPKKRPIQSPELTDYENGGVVSPRGSGGGMMASPQPAVIQPRAYELEPLDVATHLHLLGESLSLIGSRLKERDGQIAVSGSLSVLLDSVLCALGPMLCLTRLNPETDGCPPETLKKILDNIAYIMPGLG